MDDCLEPGKVTLILEAMCKGMPKATSELLPLVYDELRRMADAKLVHEPPGHTLQGTALVHEAYLRLVDGDPNKSGTAGGTFLRLLPKRWQDLGRKGSRKEQSEAWGQFPKTRNRAGPDCRPRRRGGTADRKRFAYAT